MRDSERELLITPLYPRQCTEHSPSLSSSSSPSALSFIKQAAAALWQMHSSGVLYNDWKPEHLRLQDDGRLALIDYDLCTQLSQTAASVPSSSPAFIGSPSFSSVLAHLGLPPSLSSNCESLLYTLYHALVQPLPWDTHAPASARSGKPTTVEQDEEERRRRAAMTAEDILQLVLSSDDGAEGDEAAEDDEAQQQWSRRLVHAVGNRKLLSLLLPPSPTFASFADSFLAATAAYGRDDEEDGCRRAFELFVTAFSDWQTGQNSSQHEEGQDEQQPEPLLQRQAQCPAVLETKRSPSPQTSDIRSFLLHTLQFRLLLAPFFPSTSLCLYVPPSVSSLPALAACSRILAPQLGEDVDSASLTAPSSSSPSLPLLLAIAEDEAAITAALLALEEAVREHLLYLHSQAVALPASFSSTQPAAALLLLPLFRPPLLTTVAPACLCYPPALSAAVIAVLNSCGQSSLLFSLPVLRLLSLTGRLLCVEIDTSSGEAADEADEEARAAARLLSSFR